jgi:hypothetical protein
LLVGAKRGNRRLDLFAMRSSGLLYLQTTSLSAMKIFRLFLVMLLGCAFARAQNSTRYEFNDIQLSVLKIYNIKRERCFEYKISRKGKIDSSLVWTADLIYDNNGGIIERMQKTNDKFSVFYSLSYNKFNAVTKRQFKATQDTVVKDKISEEFDYDSQGRQIDMTEYNKDTTFIMRHQNVYDSRGKCVKIMYKRESNHAAYTMPEFKLQDSLFYDPDGRINSIQRFKLSGTKGELYLYNYEGTDEKTITIVAQYKDTQHILSQKKYDRNGLEIESLYCNNPFSLYPDEAITVEKYYYNTNSTLNTKLGYFNGKVVYIYKFFYDN